MSTSQPVNQQEPDPRRASVRRASKQAGSENVDIRLSTRDSDAVIEALAHPAPAGPALRRAVERYQALIHEVDK